MYSSFVQNNTSIFFKYKFKDFLRYNSLIYSNDTLKLFQLSVKIISCSLWKLSSTFSKIFPSDRTTKAKGSPSTLFHFHETRVGISFVVATTDWLIVGWTHPAASGEDKFERLKTATDGNNVHVFSKKLTWKIFYNFSILRF